MTGRARDGDGGRECLWLALTFTFAAVATSQLMIQAFAGPWVVQDDARQFLFWMRRWLEPDLFPGDLISRYFEAVSPLGFTAFYRSFAALGVDPFLVGKLLPLPLALATAWFGWRFARAMALPPPVACMATGLMLLFVFLRDDFASATPRAFAAPLFLAFLDQLARRRPLSVFVCAGLQGLFYPQIALVAGGVAGLVLIDFSAGFPWISRERLLLAMAGLAGVGLSLLPFAFASSEFGPAIGVAAARADPMFLDGGRVPFFQDVNTVYHYLCGRRSGFFPGEFGCYEVRSNPLVALALFVVVIGPVLLLARRGGEAGEPAEAVFARSIPLRVLIAAAVLFVAAHLLLFDLHLPARYGKTPLRLVVPIALMAVALPWAARPLARWHQHGATGLFAALLTVLFVVVLVDKRMPRGNYVQGGASGLYTALASLPPDTLVASLEQEADNLPSLARRPVLIANEYMIPYSAGYYRRLQARTRELIAAIYALEVDGLAALVDRYRVGVFVIRRDQLARSALAGQWWSPLFPEEAAEVDAALASGTEPALATIIETCDAVSKAGGYALVPVSCLSD